MYDFTLNLLGLFNSALWIDFKKKPTSELLAVLKEMELNLI